MPSDFTVVAIIAAYNEADIIEHVVRDLVEQGIGVYFLDDGRATELSRPSSRISAAACCHRTAEGFGHRSAGCRLRLGTDSSQEDAAGWETRCQLFIHHDATNPRESVVAALAPRRDPTRRRPRL